MHPPSSNSVAHVIPASVLNIVQPPTVSTARFLAPPFPDARTLSGVAPEQAALSSCVNQFRRNVSPDTSSGTPDAGGIRSRPGEISGLGLIPRYRLYPRCCRGARWPTLHERPGSRRNVWANARRFGANTHFRHRFSGRHSGLAMLDTSIDHQPNWRSNFASVALCAKNARR